MLQKGRNDKRCYAGAYVRSSSAWRVVLLQWLSAVLQSIGLLFSLCVCAHGFGNDFERKKKCIWFTENYITCTQPLMIPLCECSSSVNKVEVLLYRGCFVFTTCRLQCASFLILHNFFLIHGMALLMDLKVTLNLKYNLMSITSMFCTNKDFAKPFLLWWISFLRVCSRSCIDCIYMLARMSGSGLADW